MNSYIERIEKLPFALVNGLQINIFQAILLVGIIAGLGFWLVEKVKKGLMAAMVCGLGFFVLRSLAFINTNSQHKIIVYNVTQHRAIDFISGRNYLFVGDTDLQVDDFCPANFI